MQRGNKNTTIRRRGPSFLGLGLFLFEDFLRVVDLFVRKTLEPFGLGIEIAFMPGLLIFGVHEVLGDVRIPGLIDVHRVAFVIAATATAG